MPDSLEARLTALGYALYGAKPTMRGYGTMFHLSG